MTHKLVIRILLGAAACAVLVVSGCQQAPAATPVLPPPEVSVIKPVMYPVQSYYEYNGSLEAVERVEVTARVKGFLDEIAFKEGDEVNRGDLLFRIDPREYTAALKKAQADQRRAVAELKHAQQEEKRGRMLLETSAISDEDVERRVAARETAEAMVMQSEALVEAAQLQLSYTEIRAPITGQISRTLITRGNLVGQNENTLLTTILSMDPLYVYFDAPERDLLEYQKSLTDGGQSALLEGKLPIEIGVGPEKGYPHRGNIDFRENRVDPGTGTVRMRGRVDNPKVNGNARLLYPGLYARVRVPKGEPKMLPALPEDALMTGQEGRYVYVLGEGNVIQKRTVTVGPAIWKVPVGEQPKPEEMWSMTALPSAASATGSDAETPQAAEDRPMYSVVAIESGLTTDDQVVFNGLTKARPGFPVVPEMWELKQPADPGTQ